MAQDMMDVIVAAPGVVRVAGWGRDQYARLCTMPRHLARLVRGGAVLAWNSGRPADGARGTGTTWRMVTARSMPYCRVPDAEVLEEIARQEGDADMCNHRECDGCATDADMERYRAGDECPWCGCTLGSDGYWYI